MTHEARLFFIALQFLTRVPVPAWVGFRDDWLHDSARHFPGVGLLVGGFAALVLWTAAHAMPAPVAVVLSMLATVWLTGAFHEDGLADTCDALGGTVSRARALEIMKDSRIGTYGAVALLLALALKGTAIHGLAVRDFGVALAALPLVHALSRLAPVLLLRALSYAGDPAQAKAKPMAQRVSAASLAVALAWAALALAAAAALGIPPLALLAAVAGLGLTVLWMAGWLQRRLGGYTGDTLGASQQIGEIVLYLALLGALGRGA